MTGFGGVGNVTEKSMESIDKELEFSPDFLAIECQKTRDNFIVTLVDTREGKAWLTYLFDDSSYYPVPYQCLRMAKEVWIEFCMKVDSIPEDWVNPIHDAMWEVMREIKK